MRVLDPLNEADLEKLRGFERTHGLRILLQPGGLDTIAPTHAGVRSIFTIGWMPST